MPPRRGGDVLATADRPHLVGVAGTGMSALATLLLDMGKAVSGCDGGGGATLGWLARRGVDVGRGHAAEHVDHADLVVASAAVPSNNPDLVAARRRGLPILSHAQALGALMAARRGVAVAGTHGKSTTAALIAHILSTAGRDPTLIGGAVAIDFGASSRLGHGPELVAEADEYGRRFLELHPEIAVITAIEPDHLDYYGDFAAIVEAFRHFVAGMAPDGLVVTNEDDAALATLDLPRRRLRYGRSTDASWRLQEYRPISGGGCRIRVDGPDRAGRAYRLGLSGRHNAENALAAVAVANVLAVEESAVRAALASFQGTRRRFETRLRTDRARVVDDYAHHPTAIRATLQAAREIHNGPIWAVFQPHTAHRTLALLDDFAAAFADADRVLVAPIYAPSGREAAPVGVTAPSGVTAPVGVTAEDLVARMEHPDARTVASLDEAFALLDPILHGQGRPADHSVMILTLGAGDVTTLADRLAERADHEQ